LRKFGWFFKFDKARYLSPAVSRQPAEGQRQWKPCFAGSSKADLDGDPAKSQPQGEARLRFCALSGAQSRRVLLQQNQAYRAIATRYDKLARNFLAAVHLVAAIILLN
jgi:hypothetical protein